SNPQQPQRPNNNHQGTSKPKFTKLTEELRQQLAREGKCFYCRKPGHRASDCELAKKSPSHRPKPASRATRADEPTPEPVSEPETSPPPSPPPEPEVPVTTTRPTRKTVPTIMEREWAFTEQDWNEHLKLHWSGCYFDKCPGHADMKGYGRWNPKPPKWMKQEIRERRAKAEEMRNKRFEEYEKEKQRKE